MKLIQNLVESLTSPESVVFWLPLAVLVVASLYCWNSSRDFLRSHYNRQAQFSLAIPTLVTMEILVIGVYVYSLEDPGNSPFLEAILYLFLSLIPLVIYQIWRFQGCRLFVLCTSLAQLWVALCLTVYILIPLTRW